MAHVLDVDLDHMVEDYSEMAEFDDDGFDGQSDNGKAGDESDCEDDDVDLNKEKSDTSASEARKGKDIQGIPWDGMNFTRDAYRETRLKQYKNYENLSRSRERLDKEYKQIDNGGQFFDFQFNTRLVKSTIVHFQRGKEVLNVAGPIVPSLKRHGCLAHPVSRVQISTMAVKENLMVAGGFHGELVCKYLHRPGVTFCTKLTTDENAITNAVDIDRSVNGSIRVMTANNDFQVRVFDSDNFVLLNSFTFPWSVNNTSVNPDGKLLAVLGDSTECLIADAQSGKTIGSLKGHLDYSFASAWHPDGRILATGNQDTTCRLWDVRNLSTSVSILKGRMGAIRTIKFTSDGRFMAMAEPADFVHIFDTKTDYCKSQEIDLFGEIAGITFSPDTEALFVGVADRTYGSLLEFTRRHDNDYMDSLL